MRGEYFDREGPLMREKYRKIEELNGVHTELENLNKMYDDVRVNIAELRASSSGSKGIIESNEKELHAITAAMTIKSAHASALKNEIKNIEKKQEALEAGMMPQKNIENN